jgi:hypothetical protein
MSKHYGRILTFKLRLLGDGRKAFGVPFIQRIAAFGHQHYHSIRHDSYRIAKRKHVIELSLNLASLPI